MLKSFFEVGADASLFERLEITREAELCAQHIGKYPVIAVTLKDVSGESYDDALKIMSQVLKKEARRHQYLLESIALLSEMLAKHYGTGVIILIDEYDIPLDKAYQNRYYPQMVWSG